MSEVPLYRLFAPVELGGSASCECAKLDFYGVGTLIPVHLHSKDGSMTKVSSTPLSFNMGTASDVGDPYAPASRVR